MPEVTMLDPGIILTGIALVVATVLVRAVGTRALIQFLVRRHSDVNGLIKSHRALPANRDLAPSRPAP